MADLGNTEEDNLEESNDLTLILDPPVPIAVEAVIASPNQLALQLGVNAPPSPLSPLELDIHIPLPFRNPVECPRPRANSADSIVPETPPSSPKSSSECPQRQRVPERHPRVIEPLRTHPRANSTDSIVPETPSVSSSEPSPERPQQQYKPQPLTSNLRLCSYSLKDTSLEVEPTSSPPPMSPDYWHSDAPLFPASEIDCLFSTGVSETVGSHSHADLPVTVADLTAMTQHHYDPALTPILSGIQGHFDSLCTLFREYLSMKPDDHDAIMKQVNSISPALSEHLLPEVRTEIHGLSTSMISLLSTT